jgi:hypothetical protein
VNGGTNNTDVNTGSDTFSSLVSQLASTTTSTNGQAVFTCAGLLSNFQVTASGAPGTGNDYAITVRFNNGDTTLACSIQDSATTCSDTTDTLDIDPGDEINVEINPGSGPTARNFDWSASVATPPLVYP